MKRETLHEIALEVNNLVDTTYRCSKLDYEEARLLAVETSGYIDAHPLKKEIHEHFLDINNELLERCTNQ